MAKVLCDLDTPCFVLDINRMKQNTRRMRDTCAQLNLKLRPHTKTHKTLEGALLQTGGSERCIAVSTLAEAEFYASKGFDDILLAHPFTESKLHRCLALVKNLESFHVLVSGPDGLATLKARQMDLPADKMWSVMLEVDAGYGRTGYDAAGQEIIDAALSIKNSPRMKLTSVYCHCGDMYSAFTREDREAGQRRTVKALCSLEEKFKNVGLSCPFGTGSTPTCSLPIDQNSKLSEFHPGNYIFYDYQQYLLNSCRESDIACRVMTRVIGHKPEHSMILVDCGFTAISHDGIAQRLPKDDFCLIQGESNLKMIGMSQEIGKVVAKEGDLDCSQYPVGTTLFIYPYHGCAAAAMHRVFYVHSGEQIVARWSPVSGW